MGSNAPVSLPIVEKKSILMLYFVFWSPSASLEQRQHILNSTAGTDNVLFFGPLAPSHRRWSSAVIHPDSEGNRDPCFTVIKPAGGPTNESYHHEPPSVWNSRPMYGLKQHGRLWSGFYLIDIPTRLFVFRRPIKFIPNILEGDLSWLETNRRRDPRTRELTVSCYHRSLEPPSRYRTPIIEWRIEHNATCYRIATSAQLAAGNSQCPFVPLWSQNKNIRVTILSGTKCSAGEAAPSLLWIMVMWFTGAPLKLLDAAYQSALRFTTADAYGTLHLYLARGRYWRDSPPGSNEVQSHGCHCESLRYVLNFRSSWKSWQSFLKNEHRHQSWTINPWAWSQSVLLWQYNLCSL